MNELALVLNKNSSSRQHSLDLVQYDAATLENYFLLYVESIQLRFLLLLPVQMP